VSVAFAALALCGLTASGHTRAGIALAAGLVIGSFNGLWARRTVGSEIPFRAASLGRLAVLSAIGLAIGFALGSDVAWLTLIGLAIAQFILAGAAFKEILSNR
jgi:hypothetical protein